MEDINEKETNTTQGTSLFAELCTDHEHVIISTSRFEELLKAETRLDIVHRARQKTASYDLQHVLDLILETETKDETDE